MNWYVCYCKPGQCYTSIKFNDRVIAEDRAEQISKENPGLEVWVKWEKTNS